MSARGPESLAWDVSSDTWPDAFESYRRSMADLYEISGVPEAGRIGFQNRTSVTLFDAGSIGHGRSVGQTLTRGPTQIRGSGLDAISVIVDRSGIIGDCDGTDVRSTPGSVHFRDLARPSAGRVERIDLINMMIPRDLAPDWVLAGDIHGLALSGESAAGRLVASHLSTLSEVAVGLTQAEGEAAIGAAFLIAERAFGRINPLSSEQSAAVYRTVQRKAARIIDARLLDPGLTVDAVARAAGVSRTTLYRAFEAHGGVLRHIQNRRLDRARAALRVRMGRFPTVSEVAWRHGFPSAAHFSRLFRDRFGHPPGETAPRLQREGSSGPTFTAPIGLQAIVDWIGAAEAA